MGVTSSRDLAIVIGGHTIVMGWPTKKHKVVYVLVIGLHQSHWVTHHSHCVARLSYWAAHHSHCVARLSYWAAHHSHCVARLSYWAAHHSHCVARLSHWAAHLSHCAAHHRHGVPTVVLGKYTIVDAILDVTCGNMRYFATL